MRRLSYLYLLAPFPFLATGCVALVAPWFLVGAAAAGIPLVLHLLFQRRGPRVYFSTLRFLKHSVRKTARRKRIENLLLLLFRMALLGLLAMALAEPLIPSRLAGSGPRETVIILDNSYSMSTRQLGVERFRTAKDIAGNLLRQSGKVALIITGGPESHRQHVLAPVDNEVRSLVSNCRIFAGRSDITAFTSSRSTAKLNRSSPAFSITDFSFFESSMSPLIQYGDIHDTFCQRKNGSFP